MTFLNEEEPGSKKTPIHLLDDKIDEVLLKSRRVFLCDAVTNESAKEIIRKMWFLESSDPGKPILFIINSPGGSVDAGFAVWDQIQMISSPVTTLITGLAASMGSVLSLCAKPGRRFATPHARIMIHQPSIHGVIKGQATDLKIQAEEIIRTRKALVEKYVAATGQDSATIEKALDRDTWMSAQEALAFGLLDKVVTSNKDLGV